ncbi:RNA-binding protein MEX3A-like isoform X2 [Engraulis encrasicolus]|uniref:RNA-binding protein MEX3A-like isoform X2 n=1 Tax=Engraulis encrasicolus TaxID=184585 RepID=UPI002FCEBCA5
MPSPLFHPDILDHDRQSSSPSSVVNGMTLTREPEQEAPDPGEQEAALRYALDQLSILAMEKVDQHQHHHHHHHHHHQHQRNGLELVDSLDSSGVVGVVGETSCNGVMGGGGGGGGGYVDLNMLDHQQHHHHQQHPHGGCSSESPNSCSPSPEYYGGGGSYPQLAGGPNCSAALGDPNSALSRKRSVNMTECVAVPTSEHVAEIVGRQGCKIKALRAKTNTYIKTPVRGEEPVFIVTGRQEDVQVAKREIVSAAEHFSMIRASRCKAAAAAAAAAGSGAGPAIAGGGGALGPPNLPGQTTIQVRVPYRVVGLVVGPKGATIKRIQQQTHTYIVTPSREKDPVFEVTGMPENVERAREEIETHITLRTGAFVDLLQASQDGTNHHHHHHHDDFHSNGTDVSLEGLGGLGAASPAMLWSRATNHHHHSAAGPPPPPSLSGSRKPSCSAYPPPLDSSSSMTSAVTSSSSAVSSYPHRQESPTSPFSTGSSSGGGNGGGFSFGPDPLSAPPSSSDELTQHFDFSSSNIWSPFTNGAGAGAGGGASGTPVVAPPTSSSASVRRNSSALTPRLSPTLPGADPATIVTSSSSPSSVGGGGGVGLGGLETHPLARRAQSDPLSTLAWLQTTNGGGGSSFSSSSSTGYSSSSCSASSLPGGSPTESEGGGGGMSGGILGRLKSCSVSGGTTGGLVVGGGIGGVSTRDCCVCFESEVTAALVPCGHNLFCMECAAQILQQEAPVCPKCRTPTTQCIRIFS